MSHQTLKAILIGYVIIGILTALGVVIVDITLWNGVEDSLTRHKSHTKKKNSIEPYVLLISEYVGAMIGIALAWPAIPICFAYAYIRDFFRKFGKRK